MAKYKIIKVPKLRNGGSKRKLKTQVPISNWDSPVGPINNNPASVANLTNNNQLVNQPDLYNVDPVYQQEPTLNENIDRLYNKVYAPQLETEDGLYETLQPEDCPHGKVPYKGECIDKFTVRLLKIRVDEANADELVEREMQLVAIFQKIQEIEQLKQEEKSGQNQQNFNVTWEQYTKDALKKGNKHKKLEPIFSFSEDMFNQQIQPIIDQFEEYYFEKGSDGKVNFYPKHVISGLIYDQGVRPNEFKKYHGLDSKQIQNEFGSLIAVADHDYNNNVSKELLKKIKSGMSAEDARKELEKEGWGTKKGVDQNFKDVSELIDEQLNSDVYFTDDNGVMYKKDTKGNIFQYTSRNQWNNNNFSVLNDNSNFKNDYKNQFTWNFDWKPVDKSLFKTDDYGRTTINNSDISIFTTRFPNRKKQDTEESILKNYETTINSYFNNEEKEDNINNTQANYLGLNNLLFDKVYGSNWSGSLDTINPISDKVTPEYAEAYNDAVNQMNALTEIDMGIDVNPANIKAYYDVSNDPESVRKQKAKILEEFNNKVNKLKFKVEVTDVSLGKLSGNRDIGSYKDLDKFVNQKKQTIDQEAKSYLQNAFLNNILPTELNAQNTDEYRGSNLVEQYGTFENFLGSPEAQNFLQQYRAQPTYAQTLFGETYKNQAINEYRDKSKKELEDAKFLQNKFQNNLKTAWDNPYTKLLKYTTGYDVTKIPFVIDQLASFANQPKNTLEKWTSGQLQDPMVGTMSDQMTESEADAWTQAYGPGGRQLFYNKSMEFQKPIDQAINLFDPFHWAAQTGSTAYQNYVKDNPEINNEDVALNAFFAAAPYSKSLQALSGARLLPKLSKAAPIVSKLPQYQIARNLVTPGNALLTKFGVDAFNLDPDNPGFAIEAGKNIYEGLQTENEKQVNENILPFGMGLMIGRHGYKNLRDARPLAPAPFKIDPTVFDRMYYTPKQPGTGLYKYGMSTGGELPKASLGKGVKEKRFGKEKEREKENIIKAPELPLIFEPNPIIREAAPTVEPQLVFPNTRSTEVLGTPTQGQQLSIGFPEEYKTETGEPTNIDAFIYETVTPPTGLNLNVTANPQSPLYKAINPKTGKINFEQALSILRKTAGGDEVIESLFNNPDLWQGLDSNVLHMDAKELLKSVQQAIPALNKTEVPFAFEEGSLFGKDIFDPETGDYREAPNSTYNLRNIYSDPFRKLWSKYQQGDNRLNANVVNAIDKYATDLDIGKRNLVAYIDSSNKTIEKVKSALEKGESTITSDSGVSQYVDAEYLKELEQNLEDNLDIFNKKQEAYLANKDTFADFQLTNPRTIQFSNVDQFGYGSKEHGNANDTLAHAHVYENAYQPNALYVSQIQSDAAEQFSKMKRRYRKDGSEEFDLEGYLPEFEQHSTGTYFSPNVQFKPGYHMEQITGEAADVIKRNLQQKRVLMTNKKSTEKRLIQEMLQYAAEQGKKYLYIPTPKLSKRIQGNDKAAGIYNYYKKHYTKLFGESGVLPETDQFGNEWLRLEVPESYIKGEGIIEAYKEGGYKSSKRWPQRSGRLGLKRFVEKEPLRDIIEKDFGFLHEQKYCLPFNVPDNAFSSNKSFVKPEANSLIFKDAKGIDLNTDISKAIDSAVNSAVDYGKSEPGQATYDLLADQSLFGKDQKAFPYIYPGEYIRGMGNVEYQPYSEGWWAQHDMKTALEQPQWVPGKEDFFTDQEIVDLVNQQKDYYESLAAFDEMHPESPGMEIMRALSGDTSRDELFANLFPNASIPNFRSKILSPEQTAALNRIELQNRSFQNKAGLSNPSLKTLGVGQDILPKQYNDLLTFYKGSNWLKTAPAKDVVMEMRGLPELKGVDIKNASPLQLETWRDKIVKKMEKRAIERWKKDRGDKLTGLDAYNKMLNQSGSRNQNGGYVSTKLTKKEIDKYIKGGYIIEDE